jgi:hypothetical protein
VILVPSGMFFSTGWASTVLLFARFFFLAGKGKNNKFAEELKSRVSHEDEVSEAVLYMCPDNARSCWSCCSWCCGWPAFGAKRATTACNHSGRVIPRYPIEHVCTGWNDNVFLFWLHYTQWTPVLSFVLLAHKRLAQADVYPLTEYTSTVV